jgi:hypothetical protein
MQLTMSRESSYEEAVAAAQVRPDRVICVLGMHRSGTSCLAGSLQQQGLFLGEHNTRAPWNLRGNRENLDVMKLQDDILARSGGAWDAPPPSVEWKPEHFETARGLLAAHADNPVWGFKDPRTVLTFDGWKQLVPDLQPIGIFRHPLRVAQSLEHRNQFGLDRSLELWKAYNERLLELWHEKAFPVVSFDEEPDVLQEKLLEAGAMIGLSASSTDEPFFTDELRHAPAEGGSIPPDVERLHDELRALAI